MKVSGTSLFALGLAAQQAVATWDIGAPSYSAPEGTYNQCSQEQSSGFDWQGLNPGDDVNNYGGFGFSGFQCSDSPYKRDVLLPRGFQSKCITGTVPYGYGSAPSGPQMSCDKSFSVKDFHVTTERDTDVTFCYNMPDGSTCKSTHSCSSAGTYVSNDQCGGATGVSWEIPGDEEGGEGCGIGLHNIGFHCGPPAYSTPYTPSSTPNPYTSTPVYGTPPAYTPPSYTPGTPVYSSPYTPGTPIYSSPYTPGTPVTSPTSVPGTPIYSSPYTPGTPIYSSPSGPGTPVTSPTSVPGTPIYSSPYTPGTPIYSSPYTPGTPIYSSPFTPGTPVTSPTSVPGTPPAGTPPAGTPPAGTPPAGTPPAGTTSTTVITYSTLTTCPAGFTVTSGSSTFTLPTPSTSTVVITSTSTICTKCTGIATTVQPTSSGYGGIPGSNTNTVVSPTTSAVSSPPPEAQCPDVLAKCMNTWMFKTGCKNNMDYSCYCPQKEYTKMVLSCVDSWAQSESEKSAAMSCMAGICAPYIPQNPGIITHVPTTVTVCPPTNVPTGVPGTTGVPGSSVYSPTSVPASTITLTTTQTSTCTEAACTGSTSVVTGPTTVTIPQVHFTTATVTGPGYSSTVPGLVPGTPAPAPVSPTPYYPVPSSMSSVYGPASTGGAPPAGYTPSPSAPIPTNAAGKVQAGSIGGLVVAAVAAYFL